MEFAAKRTFVTTQILGLPRAPMIESKAKREKERLAEMEAEANLNQWRKECVAACASVSASSTRSTHARTHPLAPRRLTPVRALIHVSACISCLQAQPAAAGQAREGDARGRASRSSGAPRPPDRRAGA